jgi:hypothetical protein
MPKKSTRKLASHNFDNLSDEEAAEIFANVLHKSLMKVIEPVIKIKCKQWATAIQNSCLNIEEQG